MPERSLLADAAQEARLDLSGVVRAAELASSPDLTFFHSWVERGYHGWLCIRKRIRDGVA